MIHYLAVTSRPAASAIAASCLTAGGVLAYFIHAIYAADIADYHRGTAVGIAEDAQRDPNEPTPT